MAASTTPLVLALNGGSSSLKFALFRADVSPRRMLAGKIERIGLPDSKINWRGDDGLVSQSCCVTAPDHTAAVRLALDCVEKQTDGKAVAAVGHRVVHGGMNYTEPVIVTPEVLAELRRLSPYDPEHLPAEIAVMEAVGAKFPNVPQMACFDTAFHRGLPRVAQLLAIPRRLEAKGVRRYGFHGLSYEFLMEELTRTPNSSAVTWRRRCAKAEASTRAWASRRRRAYP